MIEENEFGRNTTMRICGSLLLELALQDEEAGYPFSKVWQVDDCVDSFTARYIEGEIQ